MKKEDGWVVWLLVRVTAIMCGTEAHWCRHKLQAGCSRSRSGSPLNSFRSWHPSSHLPADRLRKAHSMSRSIAGYRLRSARTCSYSTSSKPFRGPSREPQIARCVRLGSPLHLAAAACARHLWALQARWTVGICTPYLNFGFRTRATAL